MSDVFQKPIVLSMIIPALNEEGGIRNIIERVIAISKPLTESGVDELELIVVDDGSTDLTADQVKQFPEVRLVQHAHNIGYGAALKTGFHCAVWTNNGVSRRRRNISTRISSRIVQSDFGWR